MKSLRIASFAPSMCRRGIWAGMLGLAAATVGCAPAEYGHVTGKVTLDGKPVEGAEIRFAPEEGRAAWDRTEADGGYELNYTPGVKGAKTGTNTVTITTATEPTVSDLGRPIPGEPEIFPPDYNQNATHTVEVKPGENVFDFDVTSGR